MNHRRFVVGHKLFISLSSKPRLDTVSHNIASTVNRYLYSIFRLKFRLLLLLLLQQQMIISAVFLFFLRRYYYYITTTRNLYIGHSGHVQNQKLVPDIRAHTHKHDSSSESSLSFVSFLECIGGNSECDVGSDASLEYTACARESLMLQRGMKIFLN